MKALFVLLLLSLSVVVAGGIPGEGTPALLLGGVLACIPILIISRAANDREFLQQLFLGALLARGFVGAFIYALKLQEFFGGDAYQYDYFGWALWQAWQSENLSAASAGLGASGYGMLYIVAGIYTVVGRNMLAVQFFNAVLGAATAPVIFLCARHIFQNLRVARIAGVFVASLPSIVLWSSQGLKDGPIVFLLALMMLATLKLGERLTVKYFVLLAAALLGLLSMRFYIFYMASAAVAGSFLIGMRQLTSQSLLRQVAIIFGMGLMLTYFGVLRTASAQLETYGNLEAVQRSRADLAQTAQSGFGRDVDVSTTTGAISAIPVGMIYLLFAPFPWQLASLRQSITLPEMVIWWASFPLLVLGVWFTLKYRLRQTLPILIFTSMLTVAYSVFQGNVGTAYRQRAQLLIFYFIFVAVGFVLMKERQEERRRQGELAKQALVAETQARAAARRRSTGREKGREKEPEELAGALAERTDF